jgi:hypothetical protein
VGRAQVGQARLIERELGKEAGPQLEVGPALERYKRRGPERQIFSPTWTKFPSRGGEKKEKEEKEKEKEKK